MIVNPFQSDEVKIPNPKIKDLRDYAKQTNFRLILGGVVLLLIVGLGLILYIYGSGAAVAGFLCILSGLFPVVLIYLLFVIIDWILKKSNSS